MKVPLLFFCVALFSVPIKAQDVRGSLSEQGLGFAQVVPGKALQFPRDHGPHPEFRTERRLWTGHLSTAAGYVELTGY